MGIGKAIATAFAEEGANLVLVARNRESLEMTKEDLKGITSNVEIFPADVSKENQVKNMVKFTLEQFHTVDALVNCAGIYGPIGLAVDVDSQRWLDAIHINLFGTFLCIKEVLPIMMEKQKGKVINFSGGGGTFPFPRFSAYGISKVAVVRLTETLAEEVKEYNIDINAVAPGPVNTRLVDQVLEAGERAGKEFLSKAIKQKEEGGVPPEKIARLVVFLASEESNGLTGRLISAVWDDWPWTAKQIEEIMKTDLYTLRRIVKERD
jgi:NAD(P)-dependent dehydrogenase (short-subunit alcohol dehydrogenase family)